MADGDKPPDTKKVNPPAPPPKTAASARGKKSGAPAKNTVTRKRARWHIKLHDTTTGLDDDAPDHVDLTQVAKILKKHLDWPAGFQIDVTVEEGMFTPQELTGPGPDTRNQILLCQVGIYTGVKAQPYKYLEYNVASLFQAMDSTGYLKIQDPGRPRSIAEYAQLYPEVGWFLNDTVGGLTLTPTWVSLVAYWYTSVRTDSQNKEAKAHPGEWESHVCEHEMGHILIPPSPDADSRGHTRDPFFQDVMHVGVYDYERRLHMTAEDADKYGGFDGVSQHFFALPDAAVIVQQSGQQEIELLYQGYPGYSKSQKEDIAKAIWEKANFYDMSNSGP